MTLQLINSIGCIIDAIYHPDRIAAFERALKEWAPDLSAVDTIKVLLIGNKEADE